MSPATAITVRYRGAGHARFELPAELCEESVRTRLTAALTPIEGVYRVDVYARQRKLSVRFIESICPFQTLTEALIGFASGSAGVPAEHACCASETVQSADATSAPAAVRLAPKVRASKALHFLPRLPTVASGKIGPIKESTVVEFFNDVLVLFLIKLHWHMITQHWLREPWRYRYEWMAAIYMIYLLVRSRRPKT